MKVEVRLLQEFLEMAGWHRRVFELPEGATVRDLLNMLPESVRERLLERGGDSIKWPAAVLVNGRRIEFLDGLNTRLKDGDVVVVSPRALFVV